MTDDRTDDRTDDADVTAPETPQAPAGAPGAGFAEDDAADGASPAVQALLARAREEYGRFTALTQITVGGSLAFVAGSPVPTHHPSVPGWLADGVIDDATPGEPIHPEVL